MMRLPGNGRELQGLSAPLPMWHGLVSGEEWLAAAKAVVGIGSDDWLEAAKTAFGFSGRLVSLWGSDRREIDGTYAISAAFALRDGLAWLTLPVDAASLNYPDLSALCPAASRMQRATHDMLGLVADGARDTRGWLRHDAWPKDYFPLRHEHNGSETFEVGDDHYSFVAVEGDGVHEIPVGPVHAGIIEPGHFRFSVVGEKVLRLEERLGYTHKGVEKLFEGAPLNTGHRLAGRVSGDSTVAFAWAYCMAAESLSPGKPSARAVWLRALMLERERVANHLGDLGALGNDAALAFGLAQFSRLREDWLRLNYDLFGHRLLMDCVVPGGVAMDLDAAGRDRIRRQCDQMEKEVRLLKNIYDEHAGLQDRFIGAGQVTSRLATQLGLCGLAARASGVAHDLRVDYPWAPYDELAVNIATHQSGDVAARVSVRFEEALDSLRLLRTIAAQLPEGPTRVDVGPAVATKFGAGWIEGWRGEVLVAIETDHNGCIRRCHCHDPSWQNWPVLEHAIIGNIVPDFPLINKSFNLSYSGHDL
jgi:Ni,Fe-hydrogenase III large subunit/Ni,Fe-hydrogenase III component G